MSPETASMTAEKYLKVHLPKNLQYLVKRSKTTGSSYYKLYNDHSSFFFRISDHFTKKSYRIISFIVGKNTKRISVERFVKNRIRDAQNRSLYRVLDKFEPEEEDRDVFEEDDDFAFEWFCLEDEDV